MAAFDVQIVARQLVEFVSKQVVVRLSDGLPDSHKPPPLVGPALQLRVPDRLKMPPITAPSHDPDGCPACDLQREMADVRGLADGLVESARPDGTLPHPQSGTLPLIEVTLRQAARQTDVIARGRPDLAREAQALGERISNCAGQVPAGGGAGAPEARSLAVEVNECWRQAYQLATAYWTEPKAGPSPVRQWFEEAKRENWDADTAMQHLQERMNGSS